jgi:homoserine kinase type II
MNSWKSNQGTISEISQILDQYDLGELVNLELNQRGYVNSSFSIEIEKNGIRTKYFLRRYKAGIHEEELVFEHNLINHLTKRTSLPVARLYLTLGGNTYIKSQRQDLNQPAFYYALFDYLPGEDRYTWINPHCSQTEIVNAARTLAQFHSAVTNLQPEGKRYEPGILNLLPLMTQFVVQNQERSKNTPFDDCLSDSRSTILQNIQEILALLRTLNAWQMAQIIIHCDFHPGNLKFQGETISGLFDFDWSKIDYRSFDLGLAIWYFSAEWDDSKDGRIRMDEARLFLDEYHHTIQELPGIGPLTPTELEYLPEMINAGNLYVLNWTIRDYYDKTVDPHEYLMYLKHSVNSIHWYNESQYHQLMEKL